MGGTSNLRVLPFRNCFVGVALQIVPCAHGFFCNCAVLLELEYQQSNVVHYAGNEQCGYGVEYANLEQTRACQQGLSSDGQAIQVKRKMCQPILTTSNLLDDRFVNGINA